MPDPKPDCATPINNPKDYQELLKAAHQLDSKDTVDGKLTFAQNDVQSRYLIIAGKHIVDATQAKAAYQDFYTNQLEPEGKNLQAALAKVTETCFNVPAGIHDAKSFLQKVIQRETRDDAKKILYGKLLKIDPQNFAAKLDLLKLALKANNTNEIEQTSAELTNSLGSFNDQQKEASYDELIKAAEKLAAAGKNDQAQTILSKLAKLVDSKDKVPNFITQVSAASAGDAAKKTELLNKLKEGILAKGTDTEKFERLLKAAEESGSADRANAEIFLSEAKAHLDQSNATQVNAFKTALDSIFTGDDAAKASFLANQHRKTFLQRLKAIGLPVDPSANLRSKIFQLASILKDRSLSRSEDDKDKVKVLYQSMVNEENLYGPSSDYDFYYYRALLGLVDHTAREIEQNKKQIIKDLKKVKTLAKDSKDPDLLARAGLLIAYTKIKEGPLDLTYDDIFGDSEKALDLKKAKPEQWQGYYIASILPHCWKMLTMREPNEIRGEISQLQQLLAKMNDAQLDTRLEEFKKKALEEHLPNENLFGLARDFYGKSFFSDAERKTFESLQDTLNRRVGQEKIAATVSSELRALGEKTTKALIDLKATQQVAKRQGLSLSAEIAEDLFQDFFETHFKGEAEHIKELMTTLFNKAQQGEFKDVGDFLSAPLALLKEKGKKFIEKDPALKTIYDNIQAFFPKTAKFISAESSLVLLTKDPKDFLDKLGKKLTEDLTSPKLKSKAVKLLKQFATKLETGDPIQGLEPRPVLAAVLRSLVKIIELPPEKLTELATALKNKKLPPLVIEITMELYQGFAVHLTRRFRKALDKTLENSKLNASQLASAKQKTAELEEKLKALFKQLLTGPQLLLDPKNPLTVTAWNDYQNALQNLNSFVTTLDLSPVRLTKVNNLIKKIEQGTKVARAIFQFSHSTLLPIIKDPKQVFQRLSVIKEFANLSDEERSDPLILLRTLDKALERILQGDLSKDPTVQELGKLLVGLGVLKTGSAQEIRDMIGLDDATLAQLKEAGQKLRGVLQLGMSLWQGYQSFRTIITGEELIKLKAAFSNFNLKDLKNIFNDEGKVKALKAGNLEDGLEELNDILVLLNIPAITVPDSLGELQQGEALAKLISERLFTLVETLGWDKKTTIKLTEARKTWEDLQSEWSWNRYEDLLKSFDSVFTANSLSIITSTANSIEFFRRKEGDIRPDPIQLAIAVSDLISGTLEIGGQKISKDFEKVALAFRSALQLYIQIQSSKELNDNMEAMKSDFEDFVNYITSFDFTVGNWGELKVQLSHYKDLLLSHLEKNENVLGRMKEQIRRSDLATLLPNFAAGIVEIFTAVQNISKGIRETFKSLEDLVDKAKSGLVSSMRGVAVEMLFADLDDKLDGNFTFHARFDVAAWRPNGYVSLDFPLRLMLGEGLIGGAEAGLFAWTLNPCGGVKDVDCNLRLNPANLYFDGETDLDGDGTRNFMGGWRPRVGASIDFSVAGGLGYLGIGGMWAPSIQFRDVENWDRDWWKGIGAFVEFQRPYKKEK